MTPWQWLALGALLVVLVAVFVTARLVGRVIRGWEERNRATFLPSDRPSRRRVDLTTNDAGAMDLELLRYVHAARGNDQHMTDAWRDEKLAEGWSAHDVDQFLATRSPIELM